jgi:Condensation domain/TubC N-terminal docking domain
MENISDLLFTLRCKGITVWADNERLRYHAAREPLTREELDELRVRRTEIVALLKQTLPLFNATEPELVPRLASDTAPLTFSQQWWWSGLELERRPTMRTVFSAVHVSGRLSVESLRRSFAELICRHESLRTRIIAPKGTAIQHIDPPGEPPLETSNLARLSRSQRDIEIRRLVEQIVNEPFFVSAGPLFSARLLKLEDWEHLLVVALDHIISDGASLGILWRDLFTLYAQIHCGLPCLLPKVPIQFADYAVWQQNTHRWWMNNHGCYWTQRLAGAEPVRLFPDERLERITPTCRAMLPIEFGETLSAALRELSQRLRTTTVMCVLTAYAVSILRLSNRMDLVVPFTTAGRPHPEVENTIGFFGTPLLLRIELREQDSFLDLLERVAKEYSAAYEHQDSCRMAKQLPSTEVLWNPHFNWIPKEFNTNYAAGTHDYGLDSSISIRPHRIDIDVRSADWGGELELAISDTERGIAGALNYRASTFALKTMERFLRSIQSCAEKLAHEPSARVAAFI